MSEKQGFLVILSAPSGCGKTTVLSRLLKRHPQWLRSVSVTTRPPRLGEKNGRDYEFVTPRAFQKMKTEGEFLESEEVFGHLYGTPRKTAEEGVEKGRVVVLTIDVQGARSVRKTVERKLPLLSIFILPPSISVLRERLEKRSTDPPREIEKRIRKAEEEIKEAKEYHATVLNRDLDQTVHEVESLIVEYGKKLERRK